MAGSWNHIVDEEGSFIGPELLDNMGDVQEALLECYGMVWWLADQIALTRQNTDLELRKQVIRWAQAGYTRGLEVSPTPTGEGKG